MAQDGIDPQLLIFRRQYLQLFEPAFLAWPPKQLLRDADVQSWLYKHLFNTAVHSYLPSGRYQLRVLKPLLAKIEKAIEDPNQDRRNLISGSLTTGFRTWEAALHLGSYLLSADGQTLIKGKGVLELGCGTGFLSILCAKQLGASHVTATDGDQGVVEQLKDNLFLNDLDDGKQVYSSVLKWGHGLKGTWVEDDFDEHPYDTVIGADITYDKAAISALVNTIRMLFLLRSTIRVMIAGAIRNAETFEHFQQACLRSKFNIEEINFAAKDIHEQTSLFYAKAVPIKIMLIKSPDRA
ncbi:hypothetical protein B0A48_05272 [Cryoendolithus antarcticus]|uniref:FAM86 N-terminal domain-containing protein n=1 Tax=Cryoendolithus antarcticus TaxID=1507870 RepID=A0A1V8TI03_9PEZI|nr:hypothetical protein B0A48_05272 [Cryoendolithus antarcticus]